MRIVSLCGLAALALAVAIAPADASKLKAIYSFCALADCKDGFAPIGQVARDPDGNLYVATTRGTDPQGNDQGTILKLIPKNAKKYSAKVMHQFTGFSTDAPTGGVIVDTAGNVYGVNGEEIFKLSPSGKKWKYKTLYTFCPNGDCSKGDRPMDGLTYLGQEIGALYDGQSPLYGVANGGGTGGWGVVYQLVPQGNQWGQSLVYDFCVASGCPDGAQPRSDVTVAPDGTLYGVTYSGGNTDDFCSGRCGVAYQLAPNNGGWNYTTLYTFCHGAHCPDGLQPGGRLARDASGNLFGLTTGGGTDSGVIFKIVPNGAQSQYTVLKNLSFFTGGGNFSNVPVAPNGDLFGEGSGGSAGLGVVFSLKGSNYKDEHDFCTDQTCADGSEPQGGLTPDGAGGYLGLAFSGATNGNAGTVFRFTP